MSLAAHRRPRLLLVIDIGERLPPLASLTMKHAGR